MAVETYGGGLWNTWFDRDLGVAGRLLTTNKGGILQERLVNINRPILRIPTLAIHLDRGVNNEGFKFNTELQLNPIIGTEFSESRSSEWINAEKQKELSNGNSHLHHSLLEGLKETAKSAEDEEIVALDLCLYDVQTAVLGGIHEEFIHSARLDNLFMSFTGIKALLDGIESVEKDKNVRMLVLFDSEEVGSLSAAGAESTLLSSTLSRLVSSFNSEVSFSCKAFFNYNQLE